MNKASHEGCQGTSPMYEPIRLHVARPGSLASSFECSAGLVGEQFRVFSRACSQAASSARPGLWTSSFGHLGDYYIVRAMRLHRILCLNYFVARLFSLGIIIAFYLPRCLSPAHILRRTPNIYP